MGTYDAWLTGEIGGNSRDPRSPAYDSRHDEAVAELADEYRQDDKKLRGAEEWVAGSFDGSHYTDVTLALHALHHTDPDRLLGSDLLARLYALARVEAAAIDEQIDSMAETAVGRAA